MISPLVRARLLGGLVLLIAFGIGVGVGYTLPRREDDATFKMVVRASDQIPAEIQALGLTPPQREAIHGILRMAGGRVRRVVEEFEPRISAAVDSTELEIRAVLNDQQRAGLDEERKKNPLRVIRHEQIDTVRR